jgi:hypothetical protein
MEVGWVYWVLLLGGIGRVGGEIKDSWGLVCRQFLYAEPVARKEVELRGLKNLFELQKFEFDSIWLEI